MIGFKLLMNLDKSNFRSHLNIIFFLIVLISFLFIFFNANKGLEFSDESYTLLRTLYPNLEIGKITYFGNVNNLLLTLFNYNLGLLKIFCICLLVFFSVYFAIIFKRFIKEVFNYDHETRTFILLSFLGVINFYSDWRLTPNYDYYNLLGIIVYLSGILLFFLKENLNKQYKRFHYLIFISSGLFFCAISKPSTFVILSFLTIICFIFLKENKTKFLLFSLFSILLSLVFCLVFLNIINLTIYGYFSEFKFGSYLKQLQDPRYNISFLIFGSLKQVIYFLYKGIIYFILIPIILFLEKKYLKLKDYIFIIYLILVLFFSQSLLIIICILSLYLIFKRLNFLKKNFFKTIFLPFVLLISYFAYSLGTNSNFVVHLKKVDLILFFVLNYFIFFLEITKINNKSIINYCFIFIILIFVINKFVNGIYKPFRLNDNIFNQTQKIKVKSLNNNLYVDKLSEDFIINVQNIFYNNGWAEGNSLIELSGRYPVFNFILDAKYVSKPWYLGGYKGSENFVRGFFMKTDPLLIKKSWIITSDYKFGISKNILIDFDVDLEQEFILIGKFTDSKRSINFNIYKPLN